MERVCGDRSLLDAEVGLFLIRRPALDVEPQKHPKLTTLADSPAQRRWQIRAQRHTASATSMAPELERKIDPRH